MEYTDIYIDNKKLPPYTSLSIEYVDIEAESIRYITTGKLKRNRLRSDVLTVKVSYLLNDLIDIQQIMQMLQPTTFAVRLFDHKTGNVVEKEMYTANKSFSYIRIKKGIKGQGFKFDLVEV